MASFLLLLLLSLFSLSSLLVLSSSTANTLTTTPNTTAGVVTITSSPFPTYPSKDLWEITTHIAKSTLARAHHLKHSKSTSYPQSLHQTPLHPRSYGGYSLSLNFGTPPQSIPAVMDTGSSLIWVPCTSRYVCTNCTFPHIDPARIPTFRPKLSSSAKIIGCKNPKCGWLFGSDFKSRCQNCDRGSQTCSQLCPTYIIQYGAGATVGLLLTDTLVFPGKAFPDFAFGCSILSDRQPEGIAGFGRGQSSLPSQLKLRKFSYCLLSHRFDDTPKSSNMVLNGDGAGAGISYTPFYKSPGVTPFKEYYYLRLRKITVGGRRVKIPYKYLVPSPLGNGGTIVDSGSTLTFMEGPIHEAVAREFEMQMTKYKRAASVEVRSGLSPCFDVSGEKEVKLPQLVFRFKGGAKMELPLANYFSFAETGVVCMTVVSGGGAAGPDVPLGPAIILGNYQQQNFYIEYDLKDERFGFRKQQCG